ncbi:hypothetical protein AYX15_06595 [Cryptococcus neoformans]|nr:hypothetical protein AYX15_06595 [Cryptococcus neoformans var. grubii]
MISVRLTEYKIPEGKDEDKVRFDLAELGNLLDWSGWAFYRIAPTWIEARPLDNVSLLSNQLTTHLLLVKRKSQHDHIACIYPISSFSALSNVINDNGDIKVQLRRAKGNSDAKAAVVIGTASDASQLNALIGDVVRTARGWLLDVPAKEVVDFKPFPSGGPLDGVGFCTWSSLGEDIRPDRENMSGLFNALMDHNLPIQSFILDDGWLNQKTYEKGDSSPFLSTTGPEEERGTWQLRGLYDFDAWSGLGHDGIKMIVDEAKTRFSKIDGVKDTIQVGVWMSLVGGYWDSISPDSPLIAKYKCQPYPASRARLPGIPNEPFAVGFLPGGEGTYWLPPPSESLKFWRDWFNYLKSQGVDFLKVDNQGSMSLVDGTEGVECQHALWENMVKASDEVFGKGKVIHCMSHHESIWGGIQGLGIVTEGEKFVWRNSDDFGLGHKKANAHQQHIFTNLSNSLLTSHLAMVLDADMFMSAEQDPVPHAFLRALYPGPLLLSDRPGIHGSRLLGRMISKDKTGIARVIKAQHPAVPLSHRALDIDVIGKGEGSGLYAAAPTGAGVILGVWNVREDNDNGRVVDKLTFTDVKYSLNGKDMSSPWLIVESDLEKGGISRAGLLSSSDEVITDIVLQRMKAASFWLTPLRSANKVGVAVLGLTKHFAGLMAVTDVQSNDTRVTAQVNGEGTFGFVVVSSQRPMYTIHVDDQVQDATLALIPSFHGVDTVWLIETEIRANGTRGDGWTVAIDILG